MSKKIEYITLILLCVVAFVLRTLWLDYAPKGALIDEAHFGYLAKSILETGRDEHGVFFPLNFKGFGDDKLPLQVYLLIPVIRFFGLNTATIRYPSVILGTFLPAVIYFLLKKLKFSREWSLVGAYVTVISPWTFILSRFGFESNIALFFFCLGLLGLAQLFDHPRKSTAVLAAVAFALTWYAYIAYRPITFILMLITCGFAVLSKKLPRKVIVTFLLAFVFSVAPLFHPSVIGNNSTRVSQVGIFSDAGLALHVDEFRNYCSVRFTPFVCKLGENKVVSGVRVLSSRYLDVFSPRFLVLEGEKDELFLTVQDFGQFMIILYPFIIVGILASFLIKQKGTQPIKISFLQVILWSGLLLSPIPAILAGHPQKVRISALFPFILIAMIIGMRYLYDALETHKKVRSALFSIVFVLLILQSFTFYVSWFSVHAAKRGYMYQSYLPELFDFLAQQDDSTKVVIEPFFSDPLMFYAFYTKMDPKLYRERAKLGKLEDSGFQHTEELGNIIAKNMSIGEAGCDGYKANQNTLFVTDENIAGAKKVFIVYSENEVDARVFVYNANESVDVLNCPK